MLFQALPKKNVNKSFMLKLFGKAFGFMPSIGSCKFKTVSKKFIEVQKFLKKKNANKSFMKKKKLFGKAFSFMNLA
jgi:hypothetical protein